MMKTTLLVVGIERYSFQDAKDNRVVQGAKCRVIQPQNATQDAWGDSVVTVNIPYEKSAAMTPLPAMVECDVAFTERGGKTRLDILDVTKVTGLKLA